MASINDDGVTIIGQSVTVRGNLSGDEDLHVLGRVEGSLELDRTLVVAESGIIKAEVQVRNAIVSGIVVGNIHASDSVEVTREGRMVGDITAPRVILVDGASFRGNIDMGDIENMPQRPPRSERSAPRPVSRPATRAAEPAPAKDDEEDLDKTVPVEKPAAKAPAKKTVVTARPPSSPSKRPGPKGGGKKKKPKFLDPPKAKALPKKNKKRVVVKRK